MRSLVLALVDQLELQNQNNQRTVAGTFSLIFSYEGRHFCIQTTLCSTPPSIVPNLSAEHWPLTFAGLAPICWFQPLHSKYSAAMLRAAAHWHAESTALTTRDLACPSFSLPACVRFVYRRIACVPVLFAIPTDSVPLPP